MGRLDIEFVNLTKGRASLDLFRKVISKVLAEVLKTKHKVKINIALIGSSRMQALNKKYRNEDKVTDVLAFENRRGGFVLPPSLGFYLGEIIICYPEAQRQARNTDVSLKGALGRLTIHGTLHLLGFEHEGGAKDKMREIEDRILKKLKL